MAEPIQFEITFDEENSPPDSGELVTLPLWSENIRAFPVVMALSSLFTVTRGERRLFNKLTPVSSDANLAVYYKGEELRVDGDHEVWLLLMHMARGRAFNGDESIAVSFSGNEFLNALGWPANGSSYKRLAEILDRLQHTQVVVIDSRKERVFKRRTMSFVSNFEVSQVGGKRSSKESGFAQWTVLLDHYVAEMYLGGMIQIRHDKQYRSLKPTSRKMLDLVLASASDSIVIDINDLIAFLGAKVAGVGTFKQSIKLTLEELQSAGLIHKYAVDTSDVVHITKNDEARINRGTPSSIKISKALEMAD